MGHPVLGAALARCSTTEDGVDLVVSTAHKAKGREWDRVELGADFDLATTLEQLVRGARTTSKPRAQS